MFKLNSLKTKLSNSGYNYYRHIQNFKTTAFSIIPPGWKWGPFAWLYIYLSHLYITIRVHEIAWDITENVYEKLTIYIYIYIRLALINFKRSKDWKNNKCKSSTSHHLITWLSCIMPTLTLFKTHCTLFCM